ncbi:Glu/Leu/Phe/Val family dehydrogenase [Kutzneria albida]|nr:Glu/Leu/Phe/Val dehydrogenase dimerization domain-containing protein [Kutzneria albida]
MFELMDEWGPEKVVCVSDTRTGMRGVLVIDNTARGMGKGGTRMSPGLTVAEVARLARVMTWKWAGVDLFHGGAKAGIRFDPARADKEAVLRAFVRALSNEVPAEYVLGLDVGMTERDAAVVQDELRDRGAAVGTPAELGGVPYDQLGVTGYGLAEATDAVTELTGARVAIQGFGAVGRAAAKRYAELGATVVAVSSALGVRHDPDGLDVAALLAVPGDRTVTEYRGGRLLALGEELLVPAEVLVPAATQDVIDVDLAGRIGARVVVEGANLPTTPAAQRVLATRGVTVLPDFIANAGGVVAAAYAMDARYSALRPDPAAIYAVIADKLRANAVTVLDHARALGRTTHEAARDLAQTRVREAMRLRGRLPNPS